MKTIGLRRLIPSPIKGLLRMAASYSLFSDHASFRRYVTTEKQDRHSQAEQDLVELRIRNLNNHEIAIRSHSTDARVLFSTFVHAFHLPPASVPTNAAFILDLGCNIGLTAAHFAARFPMAKIVAVELDGANAKLARRNTQPWSDRCVVVEGAVWHENGEVQYERINGSEDGFSASSLERGQLQSSCASRAYTIAALLESQTWAGPVDYVKMDIEGAEKSVLRVNAESWAARVHCIKVEIHGDYTVDDCMADLTRLGFKVQRDEHHAACVVGVRGEATSTRLKN